MNNIKIENISDLINDVSSEYLMMLFDEYDPFKYESMIYTHQGKIFELSNFTRDRINSYIKEQNMNKVKMLLEMEVSNQSYTERNAIVVNNVLENIKKGGTKTIKYVKL